LAAFLLKSCLEPSELIAGARIIRVGLRRDTLTHEYADEAGRPLNTVSRSEANLLFFRSEILSIEAWSMRKALTVFMLVIIVCTASPQGTQEFNRVSGKDVLEQLDVAIVGYEIQKKSPEQTLYLVKRLIMLNKMQIQAAEGREYDAQHPNEKKSPLAALGDLRQPFYDLRGSICKDYDGILVDFDGQVKTGSCR